MAAAVSKPRAATTSTTRRPARPFLIASAVGAAIAIGATLAPSLIGKGGNEVRRVDGVAVDQAVGHKAGEGSGRTVIHEREGGPIVKDQSRVPLADESDGVTRVKVFAIIVNRDTGQTCFTSETKTADDCRVEVGLPPLKKPQPLAAEVDAEAEQRAAQQRLAAQETERLAQAAKALKAAPKVSPDVAALEAAPLCEAPDTGGNVKHAAFRSARVMQKVEWRGQKGVTLDTRLALIPAGKLDSAQKPTMCAVTLRTIFTSADYQRTPEFPVAKLKQIDEAAAWARTQRLFEQWMGCFVQHGFSTAVVPQRKQFDHGMIWPTSAMMTWETARYSSVPGTIKPCLTSWGRDLAKPERIAHYIAKKLPMPITSAYETASRLPTEKMRKRALDRDHGPAMGGSQLMYSGLIEREVDNPFDVEEAAGGGRRYLNSLEAHWRGKGFDGVMLLAMVKLSYNHGLGAATEVLKRCGGATLKAACIGNDQARGYVVAELSKLEGRPAKGRETAVADASGPDLGEILFGWLKPKAAPQHKGRADPILTYQGQ